MKRVWLVTLLFALPVRADDDLLSNEKAALIALFNATGGPSWLRHENWLSSVPPCEWSGVVCEQQYVDGRTLSTVSGLNLGLNNLRGPLPPEFRDLDHLKWLDFSLNHLTGEFPEKFLERWDHHQFELSAAGNAFSNLVSKVRVTVSASGLLCSYAEDVRYFVELAEAGAALMESTRCSTGRNTFCFVRNGRAPTLLRLARALKRVNFDQLESSYSYPFTGGTHGVFVTLEVTYGSGSTKRLETYNDEGPVEAWIAQQVAIGLVQQVRWEKESRKRECAR